MYSQSGQELRPWERPRVTREETTAGMGLILAGIVDNINTRATELGVQDDLLVTNATEMLVLRSLTLVNGIKRNTKSTRLAAFLKRSAGIYEVSTYTLKKENVHNQYELRDKINRFGEALQGDMHVNNLLTEKAKHQLRDLEAPSASA